MDTDRQMDIQTDRKVITTWPPLTSSSGAVIKLYSPNIRGNLLGYETYRIPKYLKGIGVLQSIQVQKVSKTGD